LRRRLALTAGVAAVVIAFDQLTKHLVADTIRPGQVQRLTPFLALVHTTNKGIAFGIDPGGSVLPAVVVALALILWALYLLRSAASWMWLPSGLIVGGAVGNIIDRLAQGAVTDFIRLPLGWPPFNVADAAITVGVVLLLAISLRAPRPQPCPHKASGQPR